MQAIHDQVAQLLRDQISQPPAAPPPVSTPIAWTVPAPIYVSTPPVVTPFAPPAPPPAPSVGIPSSSTIADILARNSAALTVPAVASSVPLPTPTHALQSTTSSATQANGNTSSLLASLRAAGLLPSSTSTPISISVPSSSATQAHLSASSTNIQPALAYSSKALAKLERNGVELTTASLKMFAFTLTKRITLTFNQTKTALNFQAL